MNIKQKTVSSLVAAILIFIFASLSYASQAAVPIHVAINKGTIVTIKEPSKRVSISNPDIAELNLISPTELLINGKKVGNTTLIVWDTQGKTTFFDVMVTGDINQLQDQIKQVAPHDDISAEMAGDTIVLSGHAKNQQTIDKVVLLAKAYAVASEIKTTTTFEGGIATEKSESTGKVINQITIEEAQQVLLEIKVAQIDKTKMKELGLGVLIKGSDAEGTFPGLLGQPSGILGSGTSYSTVSNTLGTGNNSSSTNSGSDRSSVFDNIASALLSDRTILTNGTSSGTSSGNTNTLSRSNTRSTSISGFDLAQLAPQIGVSHFASGISVYLRALTSKGLAKILAEPNLVVRSGQRGNFHVGTRFPVQIVTGTGSNATVSVQYEDIGIKLNFAPEVLENGVIRLKADPANEVRADRPLAEVSGIVDFVRTANVIAPIIDTRTINTSVDLKDGESLILAGLLSDDMKKNISKVPILGDIPIFGALFRNTIEEMQQKELVFFITPKFVKPIAKGEEVELPGQKPLTPEQEREFQWIPLGWDK